MAALAAASVTTQDHCFDVRFHPTERLVAAATVSGQVELHTFDPEANTSELRRAVKSHKDSCRTVCFLGDDGASLASAAADKFASRADVETGKRLWRGKLRSAGNSLLPLDDNLIIVGDDDGRITVHDTRKKQKPVTVYEENEDFISDMALGKDGRSLCATSGDGTLAVYDVRKSGTPGLIAMSDFQEDEFLSLAVVRNGTKVVCGSQTGVLCIFSWGDWGDQKDRIKGHPMSVDAVVKVHEDGILTGSSDGKVRAVAVHHRELGSRVLGIVAEHGDYPLERLALSADGDFFASASHGQPAVSIWSMEGAEKLFSGEDGAGDGEAAGEAAADSDVDSDDSDEPKPKRRKKKGKMKAVGKAEVKRKAAGGFFNDL